MSATSIIESVKNYIAMCPLLGTFRSLRVDFLPEDVDCYSIEPNVCDPIIRRYIDGSTERQFQFVFASRFFYSEESRNNIDNSGFYEQIAEWLDLQTEEGNFPELAAGKTPTKIEATSCGYLFDINGDMSSARYQIQCRLIYDMD